MQGPDNHDTIVHDLLRVSKGHQQGPYPPGRQDRQRPSKRAPTSLPASAVARVASRLVTFYVEAAAGGA